MEDTTKRSLRSASDCYGERVWINVPRITRTRKVRVHGGPRLGPPGIETRAYIVGDLVVDSESDSRIPSGNLHSRQPIGCSRRISFFLSAFSFLSCALSYVQRIRKILKIFSTKLCNVKKVDLKY